MVQTNVRCCISLPLGNLFGVTKYSTVCSFLYCAWVCVKRGKLFTKAGFYQLWDWEQVSYSPKAPRNLLPPAFVCGCLVGSITERASVST